MVHGGSVLPPVFIQVEKIADTEDDRSYKCKCEQDNEDEIKQYEQESESNDDSSYDLSYEIQQPYSPKDSFFKDTESENSVITNIS
ncbi:3499_t:CDS:2 [Funneliformis mosseae]|uniref:3499_t:CDS:1 n=1 Tax=Funneliformis mosseae TaxID=27381 RepID=A0A9N9FR73_FUNMO|nr:3499_t:CDS:2 [Funneliformis mosseae]